MVQNCFQLVAWWEQIGCKLVPIASLLVPSGCKLVPIDCKMDPIGCKVVPNWFQIVFSWLHGGSKLVANRFLSLIHISEPTRRVVISYAVFCLKKKTIWSQFGTTLQPIGSSLQSIGTTLEPIGTSVQGL